MLSWYMVPCPRPQRLPALLVPSPRASPWTHPPSGVGSCRNDPVQATGRQAVALLNRGLGWSL